MIRVVPFYVELWINITLETRIDYVALFTLVLLKETPI